MKQGRRFMTAEIGPIELADPINKWEMHNIETSAFGHRW